MILMIRALDIALFRYLNSWAGSSRLFDALVIFCASYLAYILLAVFVALLFFTHCGGKEKIRMFWATAVSVIIARLGVTELIRLFYHRPRPFMIYRVHQLLTDNEWSFPSGHAAFFFALAAVIYLYHKKWGAWFFLGALLITAGRVIAGVHYPADILGGAIIGATVAYAVFCFAERKNAGAQTS